MRRQARISAGGTLVVRSASALQVWLWLLLFVFQNEFRISRSIKPGYLDFDNLPETNFTCTGKVIGGYYADLETSCQMFHVCTVGQQDEPMDIKFLCLNGTVFDQETRVCERVDEVDCTKSEKFYSLNLELYGSTAPPIIQPDQTKPPAKPTEQPRPQSKPSTTDVSEIYANDSPTTPEKIINLSIDIIDSTEDPIQEIKKNENRNSTKFSLFPSKQQEGINDEYEEDEDEIDEENSDYEEEYSHPLTTTTIQTITTTSTTTKKPLTSTVLPPPTTRQAIVPHLISSPSPSVSSLSPSIHSSFAPSVSPSSTLDPSLLSPQEFIYRHRGPGSEAISFQRQSFRPADGVYITHAPPQQYDHFQYESSRTAPRPVPRPVPFVQRPQPTPFRPTTNDPRNQLLRPVQNTQSSEKLETSIKHRPQSFPSHLPPQPPLPFNPFYYDRKRSDDSIPENESSLSARSVAPPNVTERPLPKPKSPPRVIVTASASVSDSNGKRLNYTVGNVVSAVKPIVPINYDEESEYIFDPFFLDVPKLKTRRKTRSSKYRKVVTVPAPATIPDKMSSVKTTTTTTFSPVTSRATTTKVTSSTSTTTSTTTVAWNPEDYVDDNYEPHAYIPPVPPLAVLMTHDNINFKKQDRSSLNDVIAGNKVKDIKSEHNRNEQPKPTTSVAHTISSQSVGTEATVPVTSPTPIEAPACITSRSTDCRIRA
ncbi:flocculation protein FLO11-like [Vanessa atalanta]|uniref:flocculation protein FLO11-like n=1 Tax=Vanessa atalanta TaxID=42275 RepID=UPI001FCD598E|nr:flocculation protein FLO11-like [Vanessa atalanta]XP_047526880.1 flocculation protein FLO11-like [Vanessa atalanta]XP_047526881.1 flocculation protein FLO11-like [Vanessa atalanta]